MGRWAVIAALACAGATFQCSPLVRGNTVVFVAVGTPADPPRIVADFNGWSGGHMRPSSDGRTYTLEVALDPAARIEYLIAYKDRFVRDPGNPLSVPAPSGPPRSELRMPAYRPALPLPAARVRGTIEAVPFTSRGGERRRIRVYRSAAANGTRLPILYVHDGDIVLDALGLPVMLDSLIEAGRMAPAYVAFIDAVDRHADYAPASPFRAVMAAEIVPALERLFPADPDRRAILGLSRSTVGALDLCANSAVAFESCALLAPAIARRDFAAVLPAAGGRSRVLIEAGRYDVPLITGARALGQELERRAVRVQFVESPEGHNHTAFRASLPRLLAALFPPARSGRRD